MEKEIYNRISLMLMKLGVSPSRDGYEYLKEGIYICYSNPSYIKRITIYLYPLLAKKYGKSVNAIERNIRYSIEIGWINSNYTYTDDLFGSMINYEKAKPTNKEFISIVLENLLLK